MLKQHMYKTAYHAEMRAYCSTLQYDELRDCYLCNFGFQNTWIDASELSRFCL